MFCFLFFYIFVRRCLEIPIQMAQHVAGVGMHIVPATKFERATCTLFFFCFASLVFLFIILICSAFVVDANAWKSHPQAAREWSPIRRQWQTFNVRTVLFFGLSVMHDCPGQNASHMVATTGESDAGWNKHDHNISYYYILLFSHFFQRHGCPLCPLNGATQLLLAFPS